MPFLAMLTGPIGRWALIGLVGAGLALAVYVQTLRLNASQEANIRFKEAAEANAAVVERLRQDAQLQAQIMADQAATLARLQNTRDTITREIIRAPSTTACVDSPAVRAALDGLRRWTDNPPAAGGQTAPGGAGAAVR